MSLRKEIRSKIFSAENRKPASEDVEFLGVKISIRQPSLEQVMTMGASDESTQSSLVSMLIDYAYIPDTDEKVFDPADADSLASMPFSKDFNNVMKAINSLTGLEIDDAAKNSD